MPTPTDACISRIRVGKIMIEKHNRMPEDKTSKYLRVMKLPHPYFEPIYKKCEKAPAS